MMLALTIGVLMAGAVFLMMQRDFLRIVVGFIVLSHAVNLLLFSAGGIDRRGAPLGDNPDPATTADPLPQAFVLTAIVIAFAITVYLLTLTVTGKQDENADAETNTEPGLAPDAQPDDIADLARTGGQDGDGQTHAGDDGTPGEEQQ